MIDRIQKLKLFTKEIKVLYVEDDIVTLEHTSDFLSSIFPNLLVASNGQEGLDKFSHNNIDLVITDIIMPKLNGLEMLRQIKKQEKNCYKILLSQNNEVSVFLESIDIGVDGYILKPLDFEKLLDSLEKVIDNFKLARESKNYKYYMKQYLKIIDKSSIISKTDTNGIITYVSDSFCKISGYKKEELIGKEHSITKHHENSPDIYKQMWDTIKIKEKTWEGVLKNRSKSGSSYYVRTIITPIKNINEEVVEFIAVRDSLNAVIDDKKYLFEQLEENQLSVLILLQINEYEMLEKFYNNTTVDQVEKYFAFHLRTYLPKNYDFENIYSLGNGGFALLTDFERFDKKRISIQKYLDGFTENVKESSFHFEDMEFDLNITVSYATGKFMIYEDAKEGLEKALKNNKKINFSNDYSIMSSQEAKQNLEMIKTVKIALENYKIVSYFQPIIYNKTKQIKKYESLVRLIDENGNILSPFHFLNISKKGNYYNRITQRVLENSFKILHSINTKLSINISASDIEKKETRLKIFELLDKYSKDSHRIVFELLEDESVENFEVIKDFIREVKKRKVQIAIDDFGTGYSNFERILQFDPDIIKIDGSLIRNIENDLFSKNMVESIVLFAKKQNIETVAEYVENEKIFDILNKIGVDYSQGYYFGKPKEIK